MPVRHTNLVSASLIIGLLGATLLLMMNGPYLASAQETNPPQRAAKSTGDARVVARGKYIVEGSRVAVTATRLAIRTATRTAQSGSQARQCFINQLNVCRVGPLRHPGLPAYLLGATPNDYTADYLSLAKRPGSPRPDAPLSYDAPRCGGSRGYLKSLNPSQ
jgi:hypothetical protein